MLQEQPLPVPQLRAAGASAPLVALPTPAPRPCVAVPASEPGSHGLEAEVLASLLGGELAAGSLLDAIADRTAAVLQRNAVAAAGLSPAEVRLVAARVATGLAVTLLQSDLAERISERLAAEAPFAEGWRSCPE